MRYLLALSLCSAMLFLAVSEPHADEPSLPVTLFRNLCFEANRIDGRALRPTESMGWTIADEALRDVLGVTHDPRVELYVREPGEDRALIALKVVESISQHGTYSKGERQHVCEVIYSGPIPADRIGEDIEDFFGAEGMSHAWSPLSWARQVPDGWRYWCWANNPERGSKRWRRDKKGCIVINADWFYAKRELIRVLLKEKKGTDPPLSVISFTWTYRPTRDAPEPKPVVGVEPLGSAEEREKKKENKD